MKLLTPLGKAAFISIPRHLRVNTSQSSALVYSKILGRQIMAEGDGGDGRHQSPLVDVDCNLLHSDLMSVMDSISSIKFNKVPDALKILHHPSISHSNIIAIISPASTIEESEKSVQLLESSTDQQRNNVSAKTTVGVHPYHALEEGDPDVQISRIRALLDKQNSKQTISCVGETGLDYSEGFPEKEAQVPWFRAQLDLAWEYNLPIFLHERLAFEDTLRCIDEAAEEHSGKTIPKIIVHCFTGSYNECVEYMKRGVYTSIAGGRASCGSDEVKKCLREGIIPMNRLMIETDAPYMGFSGNKDSFFDAEGEAFTSLSAKKKKRLKSNYPNVPSALPLVLEAVCDELNRGRKERGEPELSLNELAQITTKNAMSFFGLEEP